MKRIFTYFLTETFNENIYFLRKEQSEFVFTNKVPKNWLSLIICCTLCETKQIFQWFNLNAQIVTRYYHSSLCHVFKCNVVLVQKLYSVTIDLLGFDNSYILLLLMFDSEKWKVCEKSLWKVFEISGKGVMGRITCPLPLPDPWGLPAPYPILPLPDWALIQTLWL